MNELEIRTQQEMDAVDVNFNGIIKIIGSNINVKHRYKYRVVAKDNSSIEAWHNSSVEAYGNSYVVARGNSSVVAWDNSSVEAWDNSSAVARHNSYVVARHNSSVVAWDNSSVVARGNSSVEAWGNVFVRLFGAIKDLTIHGFSVVMMPFDLKFKFESEKTCLVQKYKALEKYLDREGIKVKNGKVILFKRVSKDFLTQEGTPNETKWEIGTTVTHPAWKPESGECGPGKFHASSRPYFCDEFRNEPDDKYIAVEIKETDLYEWPNPSYPHKIAFREGKVLYEVNRFGKQKDMQ